MKVKHILLNLLIRTIPLNIFLIPITGVTESLNTPYAWIWTNSVYELPSSAWSTHISSDNSNPQVRIRYMGLPIRGIC